MLKVSVVALALSLFIVSGGFAPPANAEAEPEQAQANAADKDAADKETKSVSDTVAARIFLKRAAFQDMPGRTGLLAETPLYSVFAEEVIIRDFFQDREGGFYLDVGAAQAIKGSNTYYLEKHLGWTGIGVDALIDYAPGWAEHRPNSTFANFLVTDETGGEGVFYKSKSLGLSSTTKFRADGRFFGVEEESEEIRVPMITLNDLLDRAGVKKIDLLSMDIEGHEPKAFAGFDIDRFAPELLVVEGKNAWVKKYLAEHGYVQIERYKQFDEVNGYYERAKKEEP